MEDDTGFEPVDALTPILSRDMYWTALPIIQGYITYYVGFYLVAEAGLEPAYETTDQPLIHSAILYGARCQTRTDDNYVTNVAFYQLN